MDPKNLGIFEIIDNMNKLCHDRNLKPLSTCELLFLIFFIQHLYSFFVINNCLVKFIILPDFYRFESARNYVRKRITLKIVLFNLCLGVLVHCFIGLGRIKCYGEFLTLLNRTGFMKNTWFYKFLEYFWNLFGYSFYFFVFLYS